MLPANRPVDKKRLLIKKSKVLIWLAVLAHGGEEIRNPTQTRKPYVCYYSSDKAYKHHRQSPTTEPVRRTMNGADVFVNQCLIRKMYLINAGRCEQSMYLHPKPAALVVIVANTLDFAGRIR